MTAAGKQVYMEVSTVKKSFLLQLALLTVCLTAAIAVVCHLLVPGRCSAAFLVIPVFHYLCGMFSIFMFEMSCRMGEDKLFLTYLVCKISKFILSVLVLLLYGFAVGYEVVAFIAVFLAFYFAFLIFETRFFIRFEVKLKAEKLLYKKKEKKLNNENK